MAKQIIEQKPIVKIYDDLNGDELDERAVPVVFTIAGKSLEIYLGEENKKEFFKFIKAATEVDDKTTKSAAGVPSASDRKHQKDAWNDKHPDDQRQRWSREIGEWFHSR